MTIKDLTVYPTHTCFDDALELYMLFVQNPRAEVYLVHGICKKEDGDLYAHAWVERNGECYFAGIIDGAKRGFTASLPAFYEKLNVTSDVTKYTLENILQFEDLHDRKSGPWEPRYLELTREGKKNREKENPTSSIDVNDGEPTVGPSL